MSLCVCKNNVSGLICSINLLAKPMEHCILWGRQISLMPVQFFASYSVKQGCPHTAIAHWKLGFNLLIKDVLEG